MPYSIQVPIRRVLSQSRNMPMNVIDIICSFLPPPSDDSYFNWHCTVRGILHDESFFGKKLVDESINRLRGGNTLHPAEIDVVLPVLLGVAVAALGIPPASPPGCANDSYVHLRRLFCQGPWPRQYDHRRVARIIEETVKFLLEEAREQNDARMIGELSRTNEVWTAATAFHGILNVRYEYEICSIAPNDPHDDSVRRLQHLMKLRDACLRFSPQPRV